MWLSVFLCAPGLCLLSLGTSELCVSLPLCRLSVLGYADGIECKLCVRGGPNQKCAGGLSCVLCLRFGEGSTLCMC